MTIVPLFRGPGSAEAPAAVRRALRTVQQTGVLPAELADDLLLAATELVTNAVNAGAQTVEVLLEVPPPRVKLDVTDDAPGAPQLREPGPSDTSGRGLHIVAALARQWGSLRTETGKTVWAQFSD